MPALPPKSPPPIWAYALAALVLWAVALAGLFAPPTNLPPAPRRLIAAAADCAG